MRYVGQMLGLLRCLWDPERASVVLACYSWHCDSEGKLFDEALAPVASSHTRPRVDALQPLRIIKVDYPY